MLRINPGELADATTRHTYLLGTVHPLADNNHPLTTLARRAADTGKSKWTEPDHPDVLPVDRPETMSS